MKYKVLVFLIFFQSAFTCNSQYNTQGVDIGLQGFMDSTGKFLNNSGENADAFFLFKEWENSRITDVTGKKYTLNNVNLNIKNNQFISKINNDSIFFVNSKFIDFIKINDRNFKYQLYNGKNKFFEVLFEAKKRLSVYKGYYITTVPKSNTPMANTWDRYRKNSRFFILKDSKLIEFRLKKKEVLKFIDKEKLSSIQEYVEENKLSYRKENDLIRLFSYYDTL